MQEQSPGAYLGRTSITIKKYHYDNGVCQNLTGFAEPTSKDSLHQLLDKLLQLKVEPVCC